MVNSHKYEAVEVETGVLQGLPVSLILFVIYLSGISTQVEKDVEGCMTTSFVGECGSLMIAESAAYL